MSDRSEKISRRQLLKGAAGTGLVLLLPVLPSEAEGPLENLAGESENVRRAHASLGALIEKGAESEPWSFGIMSDTQWAPSTGRVDKGVPTEIIDDVNKQFIKAGVKFVIQVGDITQNAGDGELDELDIRARHTKALTDAGIRYFPLRGNHEGSVEAARHFGEVFPNLPGRPGFQATEGYGAASSPKLRGLEGRTYSFTFGNAAFILLDQFWVDDGTEDGKAYPTADQLDWIKDQLSRAHEAGKHAFFFAHKNILGQQHKDNLFGNPVDHDDPGDGDLAKQRVATAFISALENNGVRYYFSGHDHMYHRAVVQSPDRGHNHNIEQIITGSCSYKFYEPHPPYSTNEQPLVQERNTIGYLIATVDGPRVTVRYYSAPVEVTAGKHRGEIHEWKTPSEWRQQDTFGYSLNGKTFLVKKGESLRVVQHSIAKNGAFVGTSMALLNGTNSLVGTTHDDTPETRRDCADLVTTVWAPRPNARFHSDVLSLYGLDVELGSTRTNPFVLSLSYDPTGVDRKQIESGQLTISAHDPARVWVKAVELNSIGTPQFIKGPYKEGAAPGSYGIDTAKHIVWAVLDHASDFAVTAAA